MSQQELLHPTGSVDDQVDPFDVDCSASCTSNQYVPVLQGEKPHGAIVQRLWVIVDDAWW